MLTCLEVVSAYVGLGLVVAGASQARKVPSYRDGNLRGDDIPILRRNSESMEKSVAQTTSQNIRQLKGRRLAGIFEAVAGRH